MAPAMIPGRISGRVTVRNTQGCAAPRVAAACSSRGSTASIASRMARTISGKRHDPGGQRRPGPAEGEHEPQCVSRNAAHRPVAAEGQQQQIAGHHRRQDQRQMHQPVQRRLAQKPPARQRMATNRPKGSATRGPERHLQRQRHRLPFLEASASCPCALRRPVPCRSRMNQAPDPAASVISARPYPAPPAAPGAALHPAQALPVAVARRAATARFQPVTGLSPSRGAATVRLASCLP